MIASLFFYLLLFFNFTHPTTKERKTLPPIDFVFIFLSGENDLDVVHSTLFHISQHAALHMWTKDIDWLSVGTIFTRHINYLEQIMLEHHAVTSQLNTLLRVWKHQPDSINIFVCDARTPDLIAEMLLKTFWLFVKGTNMMLHYKRHYQERIKTGYVKLPFRGFRSLLFSTVSINAHN